MNLTHEKLFSTNHSVYAVIGGASTPELLLKLEEHSPHYVCLFRGELTIDLAEAAPYLVKLERDDDFSLWLVEQALRTPCCIFAYSNGNFFATRKHFRNMLLAQLPDKRTVHFRFYDPRVLNTYLTACVDENDYTPFGQTVIRFLCQTESGEKVWDCPTE